MKTRRWMMGLETEYAFTAFGQGHAACRLRPANTERLFELARRRHRHLQSGSPHDLFIESGARFYVDCGCHPEIATPECTSPLDAVRYQRAGDQLLANLCEELSREDRRDLHATAFKSNIDHGSIPATTWGAHESYLTLCAQTELRENLVPHLVSRLCLTGSGGFDPCAWGVEFRVSPRVGHLETLESGNSTHTRGIFHTKQESLTGSRHHYGRLHVLCGESLCSQLGDYLRVGATALVCAMTDAGLAPGANVRLASPLAAMQSFSVEPAGEARATLAPGSTLGPSATANDIQRHYLALAERHRDAPFMPDWGADVCARWRAALDRHAEAPAGLASELDWPLKRLLFERHMDKRGFTAGQVQRWNALLACLPDKTGLDRASPLRDPLTAATIERLLAGGNTAFDALRALWLRYRFDGETLAELDDFLVLRSELLELDTRFAQLGAGSLYQRVAAGGGLAIPLIPQERIRAAITEPPSEGRARLRGEKIRELSGRAGAERVRCGWGHIVDGAGELTVDLGDPFASS